MGVDGPLAGVRVVEFGGIGPGPHACMMLADLGAQVVRLVRPGTPVDEQAATRTLRGRDTVDVDLKRPVERERVLDLVQLADVLVEGFRPGVMERLGVGPATCLARNRRLVYARMTGWGQTGPLSGIAGHDINFLALSGILHSIGPAESPAVPLNLLGDYGAGSMQLTVGVLAALAERGRSGAGQVLDVAILDGLATLAQLVLELRGAGAWNDDRGQNLLDGGAPWYRTYRCADGRFVAVGA